MKPSLFSLTLVPISFSQTSLLFVGLIVLVVFYLTGFWLGWVGSSPSKGGDQAMMNLLHRKRSQLSLLPTVEIAARSPFDGGESRLFIYFILFFFTFFFNFIFLYF